MRLLVQLIRLRAQYTDYAIEIIHLDNISVFTFQIYNVMGCQLITIEHLMSTFVQKMI